MNANAHKSHYPLFHNVLYYLSRGELMKFESQPVIRGVTGDISPGTRHKTHQMIGVLLGLRSVLAVEIEMKLLERTSGQKLCKE